MMLNTNSDTVWISYSSLSDYLNCPRAYYLKNVYRDPSTGHKVQLINPFLTLGGVVHSTLEELSTLPVEKRFKVDLIERFNRKWKKVSGEIGGFANSTEEQKFKDQGIEMIKRVAENPGPLKRLAIKIQDDLPKFWLSKEENIVLCGNIDWLEYLPDQDAVHIIDFKTGKYQEDEDSWQLPIYFLLASECQKRKVVKSSYWYLRKNDGPVERGMPDLDEVRGGVLKIAKRIKLARQLNKFDCPKNGCRYCEKMERVIRGEAKFVGLGRFNTDLYVLKEKSDTGGVVL